MTFRLRQFGLEELMFLFIPFSFLHVNLLQICNGSCVSGPSYPSTEPVLWLHSHTELKNVLSCYNLSFTWKEFTQGHWHRTRFIGCSASAPLPRKFRDI